MSSADLPQEPELLEAEIIAAFEALIVRMKSDGSLHGAIKSIRSALCSDPTNGSSHILTVLNGALDAWRESNHRFSGLLQHAELISLFLDTSARITHCNDFLLRLTGWKREELIDQNWFDMFAPTGSEWDDAHKSLLGGNCEACHHSNDIVTRSGSRRLIHWNTSALRSATGEIIGTASIGEDVTERSRREFELQRFRFAMDATVDAAIYMIDPTRLCFVDVNEAACRMLDYTREELLALPPENIFSIQREELLRRCDALIEHAAKTEAFETVHCRKDGTSVPVEVERRAVCSGDSWIVVGVARDISARKQANEELRFQAHLLSAVGEALIASDLLANVSYWNASAERLYGWSAREAIGKNAVGTIFADHFCASAPAILSEIKQGRLWRGDHEAIHKDGTPLFVELSIAPVHDAEGKLTGLISVSRDIGDLRIAEKVLNRSNERFEIVTRATNDIIWDWGLLNNVVWWSSNITSSLGHDRAKLDPGIESWYKFIHPDDYERVVMRIHKVIESDGAAWQDEYRFRLENGGYVTMLDRGFIIRDEVGKAIRMVCAMMDISARKQVELLNNQHALQQSLLAEFGQKALASTNLDAIMDEAVVVVAKGIGVKFCRIMQLSSDGTLLTFKGGCGWDEHWQGRRISIADADTRERYEHHLRSQQPIVVHDFRSDTSFVPSEILRLHNIASAVEVIIRGRKEEYGVLGAYSCESGAFGADKVSFLSSIATALGTALERVRSDEKVAYLAQFDALTGLPNRSLFRDRLEQALSQAERNNWHVGVLCIDLDHFKIINDTHGHLTGDTLLTLVAQRLGNCFRNGDSIGRLGEDEFAIVLSNLATAYDANLVAQKVLAEIARPFQLDEIEADVTASIGIALFPSDGSDCDVLLKNADVAMYRAKEQGRNNFEFYTETLNARVTHRINLERELRQALEREEFELHYQPQVSLDTGRIVATEALIRWHHPQRGLLGAAEFINIAEETGLIVPIGQWVVDTACNQVMQWHRSGHRELTIAVNVSPGEIRRGNVPKQIKMALERSGLEPRNFEVEITESMAMDSAETFIDTLRAIKSVGVMIAIDDFGTGYSNLSYLKRFPIDTLKIDQLFIRDIITDTDDAVIVRAIIAMAHQLKLEVVAEGVETEAQATFLRRNHVDLVQGYLFAAPADAASFGRLLNSHTSQLLPVKAFEFSRALLIVDDEENILRALKRTLRQDGYEIHTANSARAGLDVLARTPIGVIVSDERMPEMSGTEFLGRVKSLYPDTIRIMLSGYTDLKIVTAAVNEGAIYKFLTKPWEDDALREDIRQAFRRYEDKSQANTAANAPKENS